MTKDQLDNWFTYHPPTEEQKLRYQAIRSAEYAAHMLFAALCSADALTTEDCTRVNDVTRALAEAIDQNAPDCADKTAAIRCVRLARNAANEHIMNQVTDYPLYFDCIAEAYRQLLLARWQANSAIACGGK